MSDLGITVALLAGAIVLFIWNRIPVEIVALFVALGLFLTGVLSLQESFAGFSDPTVVLIAGLFVVSVGLEASGVATWAGQLISRKAGKSRPRLILLILGVVAVLTALISVNGAVAALVPMIVIVAIRAGGQPSQLLLPLAFGAHAGSLLTLTGSPVNVLISEELSRTPGGRALGFFEFGLVGLPLLAGTALIVIVFGKRLLPNARPQRPPRDLSEHTDTLLRQYLAEDSLWRLRVRAGSPLLDREVGALATSAHTDGVSLVIVGGHSRRGKHSDATVGWNETEVTPGAELIVRGRAERLREFAEWAQADRLDEVVELVSASHGIAEVMISPRSTLAGAEVYPGMITESGQLIILAVQRNGIDLAGGDSGRSEVTLAEGDVLLLQGTWAALHEHTADDAVLRVDEPDHLREQAAPLGAPAWRALAITTLMVVLLTLGVFPSAVTTTIAAILMVLTRVVPLERAHRSMSWTTLILVAAMIPLSTAIKQTGAADLVAGWLVATVGDRSPTMVLLGLFVITVILGQLISNTATALVLIPIAVALAAELNLSPMPLLVTVCVAAAASFLTPVATPANTMVMQPGGYRFGDYWKLGLPLVVLYGLVAVFLVPLIWPFTG